MNNLAIAGLILIAVNLWVSYRGFTQPPFYQRFLFDVDRILIGREYGRLITSGFLHVNWLHLIFNMLTLYAFSEALEVYMGSGPFLLVYFAALLAGNLFSLFVHRNHGDYTAVGASGAVSGVLFAFITLFPTMEIGLFGLPLHIPGWTYGLLYVFISILGMRNGWGNISHEAHLGGAVTGSTIAILLYPTMALDNILFTVLMLLPSVLFMLLVILRPGMLLTTPSAQKKGRYSLEDRYNVQKKAKQQEIDRILEKLHRSGMKSLTKKEKEELELYSRGR
ncbi:MAG TPA: rhomboid family intramembrane serine protease [Flavisolibacter sp.]|jgi:membrane associated rhomboid family serine protease